MRWLSTSLTLAGWWSRPRNYRVEYEVALGPYLKPLATSRYLWRGPTSTLDLFAMSGVGSNSLHMPRYAKERYEALTSIECLRVDRGTFICKFTIPPCHFPPSAWIDQDARFSNSTGFL